MPTLWWLPLLQPLKQILVPGRCCEGSFRSSQFAFFLAQTLEFIQRQHDIAETIVINYFPRLCGSSCPVLVTAASFTLDFTCVLEFHFFLLLRSFPLPATICNMSPLQFGFELLQGLSGPFQPATGSML